MANVILKHRDVDLFSAVERCPLTVRQIRTLSVTFHGTFESDRRLQDRVAILTKAGLLNRYRYASTEGAGQYYYMLTPESFRLLHGHDVLLPSMGMFSEIGISRHNHTRLLADFIVHTFVSAHREGIEIESFHRENTLKLTADDEHLYPDCAFVVRISTNLPAFTFYVELDNSTEPLASPRDRDSWIRKLQFYEKMQNASPARFRVLGAFSKSLKRLDNVQMLAASRTQKPERSLFYGTFLPDYIECVSPLFAEVFVDHRGLRVGLLPRITQPLIPGMAVAEELASQTIVV